jgi:predicted phosphodiesterase
MKKIIINQIKLAIASDLHVEFDRAIYEAGKKYGADRLDSHAAIRWCHHLLEREASVAHPQFGPDLWTAVGCDLMILAGDIDKGTASVDYAEQVATFCNCPVILVPGNHEYYRLNITSALPAMRERAAATNGKVHLLDEDRLDLELKGRRFAILGATLWTDYCLNGIDNKARSMQAIDKGLNDHRLIRFREGRFRPMDAFALHRKARDWLRQSGPVARQESDAEIVVTHHAPTPQANAPQYQGGILSPAFASDMEAEVAELGADLWVSGHTHFDHDFMLGRTRMLSHQRGYMGSEAEMGFNPIILSM